MHFIKPSLFFLTFAAAAQAQLAVTVSPVKTTGQKAVTLLAMTNNLAVSVESARAICFLLDEQGKIVGQSTKWVIGGTKNQLALQPTSSTTFNFVFTSPQPWATTNLTAKVSFSRVVLDGGTRVDMRQDVVVTSAIK